MLTHAQTVRDACACGQELRHERAATEAQLAHAAEQQRIALERQVIELTGSAEDVLAIRQPKERPSPFSLLLPLPHLQARLQTAVRPW